MAGRGKFQDPPLYEALVMDPTMLVERWELAQCEL